MSFHDITHSCGFGELNHNIAVVDR